MWRACCLTGSATPGSKRSRAPTGAAIPRFVTTRSRRLTPSTQRWPRWPNTSSSTPRSGRDSGNSSMPAAHPGTISRSFRPASTSTFRPCLTPAALGHIPIVGVAVRQQNAPDGPFRYDYPVSRADCDPAWGVCKCAAIDEARAAGMQTVFVGDGPRGDACAAAEADYVFARGRLLKFCRENDIAATPFELLHPVVGFVRAHGQQPRDAGKQPK